MKPISRFKFKVLDNLLRLNEESHLLRIEGVCPPHSHAEAGLEHKWAELGIPSQPGFSSEFSKFPESQLSWVLQLPFCMFMQFFKKPCCLEAVTKRCKKRSGSRTEQKP